MNQDLSYFKVPDQYVGKSLSDIGKLIQGQGGYVPDIGAIQSVSGISANNPLTAGQYVGFRNDPGAGEYKFLSSNFGAPISSQQYQGNQATNQLLDQAKALRQFNIDSAQPQIQTLTQSKNDIAGKYNELLASIKGDQQLSVDNTTRATNATIAARGLSTQDPMAQTNLAVAQSQAAQPYSTLYAQTGAGQAQDQATIAAQIAALQSGNPEGAISSGLQLSGLSQQAQQLAQSQKNNDANLELQRQQLELQKQKASQTEQPNLNIQKIGNDYYSFNPLSGALTKIFSGKSGSGGFSQTDWN